MSTVSTRVSAVLWIRFVEEKQLSKILISLLLLADLDLQFQKRVKYFEKSYMHSVLIRSNKHYVHVYCELALIYFVYKIL